MQNIEHFTAAGFPGAVRHGTVMVTFSADWCGHCITQNRIIDRMTCEHRFPDSVRLGRVCIDEAPLIMEKLEIEAIPTTVVFCDGMEVQRYVGIADEIELLKLLQ